MSRMCARRPGKSVVVTPPWPKLGSRIARPPRRYSRLVRPLLAVDGDSLAHRAYHALPSSIRDAEGNQANMIVGFANMLLSVWEAERPRAVFVGWDTIGIPTYRHELLEGYQAGRDFPPVLTSQLDRLPELC